MEQQLSFDESVRKSVPRTPSRGSLCSSFADYVLSASPIAAVNFDHEEENPTSFAAARDDLSDHARSLLYRARSRSDDETYHVLSIAYLLMEEERKKFCALADTVSHLQSENSTLARLLHEERNKTQHSDDENDKNERREQVIARTLMKIRRRREVRILSAWRQFAHECKHHRVVMARFSNRWKNHLASKAILAWRAHADTRKWLRVLLLRLLGGKRLSLALRTWADNVRASAVERLQADIRLLRRSLRERDDRINDLEAQEKTLLAQQSIHNSSLDALQQQKRDAAERNMRKMISAWQNKSLSSTLQQWIIHTQIAVRNRTVMRRFMAKLQQQGVLRTFHAWQWFAAEEKRTRRVLARFLANMRNAGVTRVLNAWKCAADERRCHRTIVNRFASRMRNATCARAMASWTFFVSERSRLRSLIGRVLNRVCNGRLFAAWHAWCRHVAGTRREQVIARTLMKIRRSREVRILSAWRQFAHECKHHRVVMARFSNRWKNHLASKAILAWRAHADTRKWLRVLLLRLLGGKRLSLALRTWADNVRASAVEETDALRQSLRESNLRNAQLQALLQTNDNVHAQARSDALEFQNTRIAELEAYCLALLRKNSLGLHL